MCKSGGRRCPGQYDPAHIAARNARRREIYHLNKLKGSTKNEKILTKSKKSLKVEATDSLPPWEMELLAATDAPKEKDPYVTFDNSKTKAPSTSEKVAQKLMEKKSLKESTDPYEKAATNVENNDYLTNLLNDTKAYAANGKKSNSEYSDPYETAKASKKKVVKDKVEVTPKTPYDREEQHKKLNITQANNKLLKAEKGYYTESTVSGTINYNNLDENSYRAFGFEEIKEDGDITYKLNKGMSYNLTGLSKKALKESTLNENKMLNFYTGQGYDWLNKELYSKSGEGFYKDEDPNASKDPYSYYGYYHGKKNFLTDKNDYEYTNQGKANTTKENFKEMVETLDSALEKAPKRQKILYRGAKIYNESGGNSDLEYEPEKVIEWIEKNRKLGTELQFDAYTSATPDFKTAKNFSHANSIIYEIMTPEGMPVKSVSQHSDENEVLLPREQRYMVVGVHTNTTIKTNDWYGGEYKTKFHVVQLVAINSKGEVLDGTNSDKPSEVKI